MSNPTVSRGTLPALLAALAALCCGGPAAHLGGDVDPYNGVVDNSFGAPTFTGTNFTAQGALAPQFQPSTTKASCNGASSCYVPQSGFFNGQTFYFFNSGLIKPLPFATLPSFVPVSCAPSGMDCVYAPSIANHRSDGGGGWHADVFPHSCTPVGFNPVQDAFPRDVQFPIAGALPVNNLLNTSALPPLGVVAIHSVTGVSGETCNDLKYAASVGSKGAPGHFGAVRSENPTGYEVWTVFDPTVTVYKTNPGTTASALSASSFWFNGLQGSYLSGGPVPTDAQGNLVAMDAVIVGYNNGFGDPTASKVILLQYQPGDDGYSPIVRLHDYKTSAAAGSFIGVCPLGAATCPKNYVKLSDATPAAFNTILIVASPQ